MSKQAFKRMRKHLRMEVNRKPLDAYAWPGGYPLYYLCADGGALCPGCVNAEIDLIDPDTRDWIADRRLRTGWVIVAVDVNYEDDSLTCDHCNDPIESAYGPLETAAE